MNTYSLTHLTDHVLLRELAALVVRDRSNTATLLAHIAEVDARKLYVPACYPSMYAYCVGELRLSEEAAFKRIHAARAARRFPAIFDAVAEGRLHLSAVVLLAPHLTEDVADDLLAAAACKSKSEIEQLLAQRFPRPDLPTRVQAIAVPPSPVEATEHAPGRVEALEPHPPAEARTQRPVVPLAPQRYALQLTMEQAMHDKLRYAQALLSHQVPSGEVAEVLERALDALIRKLEQRKFAATSRPRKGPRRTTDSRHIPAHVKRTVRERDQGQCTFASDAGHRCPARAFLEFDHIDPVARGGQATAERMRLRCRAHNQYEAECVFGAGFMNHKRQEARRAAAEKRARATQARPAAGARGAGEAERAEAAT